MSSKNAFRAYNWQECRMGTMLGRCSLATPDNYVFHKVGVHQDRVRTRITMPALQWQKANGKNTYETLIEFATNHHWDEFQRQALIAISTLLEGEGDKR